MGKPTVQLPDPPDSWDIDPSSIPGPDQNPMNGAQAASDVDFKRRFAGQGNSTELGKAGNFAYYAIGSGILPDAMLDAGATGYHLYKTVTGGNGSDISSPFGPDASAQSVRGRALAYGASLK